MAGYSGTPLAKKLGIKPGALVYTVNAPEELMQWLAPLPPEVKVVGRKPKPHSADVVLAFMDSRAALLQHYDAAKQTMKIAGGLWVAWPKQAAQKLDPKWATDLTETDVRAHGLASGLVDNKVCAISEVWSGLRLVYRVKDR
jgi:hypothetical protein